MKRLVVPQIPWPIVLMCTVAIAALLLPGGTQLSWAQNQRLSSLPRSSMSQSSLVTQGSLVSLDGDGRLREFCPLKHTDVKIEVSGFLARATVTQQFVNSSAEKIEAVYRFPLPQSAAVDNMTMLVGERFVRADIKRREEAQAIYAAARSGGKVAGLLDQERPNIFTQSIANILPGEQVKITISYVELLKYDAGSYEVVFPMVVGPRYIPGSPWGKQGGGFAHDTEQVPDASRITPPVTPPGTRAGHDISIEVALDTGLPIEGVQSPTHEIDVERTGANQARIGLRHKAALPNKDFILRYDVAGRKIQDALLTHRDGRGGFFTLILQPPDRVTTTDVTPKELVFVLDTSGSMSGFPIEKAKETMRLALDGLYPHDTFNLITFAGDTHILFPQPVPASKENLRKAQLFLESRSGAGGTEMMKAIRAALDSSDSQQHVRIVCFMTDGYVGNDMEIIAEVQKHPNARVFAFGIGGAVNRFLLDKMAEHGRGEVEYVGLQDDGSTAARRFHERIRNPLLTDISVDWGGLSLTDIYPKRIPDLFSAKPVILSGRYMESGTGIIRLRGMISGHEMIRELRVNLPALEPRHDTVATLWARTHVEHLMGQDYNGIQQGNARQEVREAITKTGLDYRLMTQFTSFIAVEEMVITDGGQPRRIDIPVEMPEGVSYEGVFGGREADYRALNAPASIAPQQGFMREFSMAKRHYSGVFEAPRADTSENAEALKLHPAIAALVDRLKLKKAATAEEAKFVRNGRAEVQVWLSDMTPITVNEIKKLGFEIVVQPKTGKFIIGRLPIEKLPLLAEMKSVRYLAPQIL